MSSSKSANDGGGSDDDRRDGTGYESDSTCVLVRKLKKRKKAREEREKGEEHETRTNIIRPTDEQIANRSDRPRSARKDDTNYHESEDEDRDEEEAFEPAEQYEQDEELVIDDKLEKRSREKKDLDYSMMKKNKDGNVEVSRMAYRPEYAISDAMVRQHLGNRAASMSSIEIQKVKEWFEQIKIHVGDFMRERVGHEVLKNAKDQELDYKTVVDLQKAWGEATDDETLLSLAQTIDELLSTRYFGSGKWTAQLEEEAMKKFGIEYINNEGRLRKGCFNKQASRARADVSRRISRLGKKKHGMIVSRRGPNRKEGERKKRRKSRVPKSHLQFQDEFLRPSDTRGGGDKEETNSDSRRKKKGKMVDISKVSMCFVSYFFFLVCCLSNKIFPNV